MSIFNLFKKQLQPTSGEHFLALTITPEEVVAAVWNFNQNEVEVKGFAKKNFSSWENLTHQAAIAIDNAVSASGADVEKVVFGLSDYFLENGKPTAEVAKVLKNLATDLELNAQAYVQAALAVNHFLKVEEGLTPSAILVGVFHSFYEVNLIKNSSVEKTLTAKEQISPERLSALLQNLKDPNQDLPARIVLYGNPEEKLLEKLTSFNWSNIFVHQPKLDVLEEKELAKSVAYASAADILGHEPVVEETAGPETSPGNTQPAVDDFGFAAGQDVLASTEPVQEPHLAVTKEVKEEAEKIEVANLAPPSHANREEYAFPLDNAVSIPTNPKRPSKLSGFLGKVFSVFKYRPKGKKLLVTLGIIAAALLSLFYFAGQLFTQSEIIIKASTQEQEKDFQAKVVLAGTFDETSSQIAGQELKSTTDGTQKAVASGSKKTGNKAKGEIKVLNWDKAAKSFSNGTEVITHDGLKFTMDGEVQVASRSATTPGEAKIGATAEDIGPKYNIGTGIDLTIVGFDEVFYSAVTSTDISGGDEKQSTVASQDDLARLEKSLTDTLTQKAKQDLKDKNPSFKIDDQTLITKVLKKEFDKKVDEEASLINLNMQLEVGTLAYNEEDLKKLLASIASQNAPQGQEAKSDNVEIVDTNITRNKDALNLKGKYRVGFVPKINEDELKDKIIGKSIKEARSIVKEIQGVSDVQIKFTPGFLFADTIPRNKAKIKFTIGT